jgi:hypothetical protein
MYGAIDSGMIRSESLRIVNEYQGDSMIRIGHNVVPQICIGFVSFFLWLAGGGQICEVEEKNGGG